MDHLDIEVAKEAGSILNAKNNRVTELVSDLRIAMHEAEHELSRINGAFPKAGAHHVRRRLDTLNRKLNECEFGDFMVAAARVANDCDELRWDDAE